MSAQASRMPLGGVGLRIQTEKVRRAIAQRPGRVALSYIATVIVVAGTIYSLIEANTSIPDGIWWAIVTASTVGYGDISPVEIEGRFLAGWVILSGIATTALLTALLAGWILSAKIEDHLGTPDLHDDFDDLIGQLQALKARYEYDEGADDRLRTAALAAQAAWRESPDGEGCRRAMETLAATLEHRD